MSGTDLKSLFITSSHLALHQCCVRPPCIVCFRTLLLKKSSGTYIEYEYRIYTGIYYVLVVLAIMYAWYGLVWITQHG